MFTKLKTCLAVSLLVLVALPSAAQNWTNADYQKALWMTTRFYGAQRSGDNNWVLYNHLPSGVHSSLTGRAFRADGTAGGAVDLSGGWHDCGDHVKFGQTQFYSAYMLLKAYEQFPTGFDDHYSYDYTGYHTSGNYTWEGGQGTPNCIPDILDEVKHATDYFIKATPNASTFYYQVGHGGCPGDHCRWETAVKMQTNSVNNGGNNDAGVSVGTRRETYSNPNDASMASFAAATLALMSRMYATYDPAYAATCLQHAEYAHSYASSHPGTVGSAGGGQYPANSDWRDDFVCACAELYWATGNNAYRTQALSYSGSFSHNVGWSYDYANNGEMGYLNLALLGDAWGTTQFNNRITGHFLAGGSRNGNGVYTAYGSWGRLRYNGNAAYLISMYSNLNNDLSAGTLNRIYDDVDYIMGDNGSNRSYIVGFEPSAGGFLMVQRPHHRNVYLDDGNNENNGLSIPTKNQQFGALVGGQRDGSYNDDISDYVNSEVCIDYNAGLVGALGYINSLLAPADLSGCGYSCSEPDMGGSLSTCTGTSLPVTLNSNTTNYGDVTYTWYRNGSPIGGESGNTCNNCGTVTGEYIVVRDSAGVCSEDDTITISNSIPTPDLGAGTDLCSPAYVDLSPANVGDFPGGTTWQWAVDYTGGTSYTDITDETASSLMNVRRSGRYQLTATAGPCNSSANVVITSSLPTPVDGCRETSGTLNLSITNATGGPYTWYDDPTAGSSVGTGTSITTPSISSTTTYYVQDGGATGGSVGPTSLLGSETDWGINSGNHLHFTAYSNFMLTGFSIPTRCYNTNSFTYTIEILDNSGNPIGGGQTFTTDATSCPAGGGADYLIPLTFNGGAGILIDQASWGSNLRMRLTAGPNPLWNNNSAAAYTYNSTPGGIVDITGKSGGGGANAYMYFYDWQVQTGTPCDRLPVVAQIGGCGSLPVNLISFTATPEATSTVLEWTTASESNNSHFVIERSVNGVDFNAIGTVDGVGNSTEINNYEFIDYAPVYGTTYYRLAQVDVDGTVNYSNPVSVSREVAPQVEAWPNPFENGINVRIPSANKATLVVTDVNGKVVENATVEKGATIIIGAEWNRGVYFLSTTINGSKTVSKVIKY